MLQPIFFTILVFVSTTTALYAQTNKGSVSENKVNEPNYDWWSQSQKINLSTSLKLTDFVEIKFMPIAHKIYVNNDDVCVANEVLRELLAKPLRYDEAHILAKSRKTLIPHQFEFISTDNRNRDGFIRLGWIATSLYFDHRKLEKTKSFLISEQRHIRHNTHNTQLCVSFTQSVSQSKPYPADSHFITSVSFHD